MRALFPMFENRFQFVALRRSEITTVAQFKHRNVGTGPRVVRASTRPRPIGDTERLGFLRRKLTLEPHFAGRDSLV
jgi:hypothetical protein